MRTVILYESMYGNTRHIAEAIGRGLAGHEVLVTNVHDVAPEEVAAADLVVAGAPTHVHGLPRPSTRRGAVDQVSQDLVLEPEATGTGVREWLEALTDGGGRAAAAFDTRVDMNAVLSGRASKGIARELGHHGYRVVAPPESFLVDRETRLLPGELERAEAWGAELARLAAGALPAGTG